MDREALGERVRRRRAELGLSVSKAARSAGLSRTTWISLEAGARETQEYNYAPIERTLGWSRGSIEAVLAGAEPVTVPTEHVGSSKLTEPLDVPASTVVIAEGPTEAAALAAIRVIAEVLKSNLPDRMKLRLIDREVTEVQAEIATHPKRSEEEPRREAG